MSTFKIQENKIRPVALTATGLFMFFAALYFSPVQIPHKITLTVGSAFIASLWLCPWQITLALLFSALGDFMGSCDNFLGQMGFFTVSHFFFIAFFLERYLKKVERDRKLSLKAKGYLSMVAFCVTSLLVVVFTRIYPLAEAGIIRTGVGVYACVICIMLVTALLQRSSLYALGAVLFVFSDFILAWNKFVEPIPYRHYLVLVSYFLAQWLLFIRSTPYRVAPEMRLLRF